jgi:SNF2 family DNA or RNA helicase
MLSRDIQYKPHRYQEVGYEHVMQNTHCGLFLDMGLGKTVITLTAIRDLIFDELEVSRVLIIAPKRVARSVWTDEISKWAHLRDLNVSKILGTEKQRKEALKKPAHIYTINKENVCWLVGQYAGSRLPFDMLVIDELSAFKSPKSQRFKALRQVRGCFKRIVGLTGTPSPNGLLDLWSQLYLLDGGERLYKTITRYRETFFYSKQISNMGFCKYIPSEGSAERIKEKIGDICISMKTEDYLDLPGMQYNFIEVEMPPEVKTSYDNFERESFLELIESGAELNAINGATLVGKLLQFSNGAVYYQTDSRTRNYVEFHDTKLQEVEEIIENSNGQSVLIAYAYEHDKERLLSYLKKYKPRVLLTEQDETDWNLGKIQIAITHPASSGHGLNLQFGGHIAIWFGETWSLELHQQFNKRLDRQGQTQKVIIHRIICKDTEDMRVIRAIESKTNTQDALLEGLKARFDEYKRLKHQH